LSRQSIERRQKNKMEIEEMRKRKQILKHDIVTLLNTFTEETGASIFSLGINDMIYQMGVPIRIASISLEGTL
jgi:hypothetical protein